MNIHASESCESSESSADSADRDQWLSLLANPEQPWLARAAACKKLYLSGLSPDTVFQETGLDPTKQMTYVEAAEVYRSLEDCKAPKPVLAYFSSLNSDILYEFRTLSKTERLHAATLAVAKHLDPTEAKLVAVAIQEFVDYNPPPGGFSGHSGDAVAYHCWVTACQKEDAKQREQLIARGLRFAHSAAARRQLEALLDHQTDSDGP